MRKLSELDKYRNVSKRVLEYYGTTGGDKEGVFELISPNDKLPIQVIATNGGGWDHVSVSKEKMMPSWMEMEYIKRLFFKDDEVAYQLHMPVSDHINVHPYTLHIWRPHLKKIPLPPKTYV